MEITILDGYTLNPGDLSWDALASLGDLTVYDRTPTDQVVSRSSDAAVLLTNKTPLRAADFALLPDLKFISMLATGYDVVDVAAAAQYGIIVSNIPTYGTNSVAQMVMAHLLTFCHRVEHHSNIVKTGAWASSPDWSFSDTPQIELFGKTIGIVGFGRIGHQVGRLAAAFGMHVQAHDPHQRAINDIPNFSWTDLYTLFRTSDVISLNCPLTPENTGLINQQTLELMKPNAFLINASRGGLVVESDLAQALNTGRIAGAGLDVLSMEPPPAENPLLTAKNTTITPHTAWATKEARQRLMDTAVENVKNFLAGTAQNVVSRL